MIKKVYWFLCEVPFILVRVYRHLNFLDGVSKNLQISNLVKIRPVGAEVFQADGRSDGRTDGQMTKVIVAFLNFANVHKN